MPVKELPRFLPPRLTGFDVAIGSREGHGARRIGEPVVRHLAGRLFNYTVQRLMVPGIDDTQCGFKMFTAAAVERIFPLVTIDGWAFDIEALFIARTHGLRIVEVPIEWHYRRASRVSLMRDGLGMMGELLRIRSRAWRGAYGAAGRRA
jgi:dolichyl-phosphate beta-glucosyltransferase